MDCVVLSDGTKKGRMMEFHCCCFFLIKSYFKNNVLNGELIFREVVTSLQSFCKFFYEMFMFCNDSTIP